MSRYQNMSDNKWRVINKIEIKGDGFHKLV